MLADNFRTLLSWLDAEFLELEVYECPWSELDYTHFHLGHANGGQVTAVI